MLLNCKTFKFLTDNNNNNNNNNTNTNTNNNRIKDSNLSYFISLVAIIFGATQLYLKIAVSSIIYIIFNSEFRWKCPSSLFHSTWVCWVFFSSSSSEAKTFSYGYNFNNAIWNTATIQCVLKWSKMHLKKS